MELKEGILVSFEGIDTSGKSLQSSLLKMKLERDGFKVKLVHFPRYDKPIGDLIGKILGSNVKSDITPPAMQMLYVADQLDFQEELRGYLKDGFIVICDRYDLSTIAYHSMHNDEGILDTLSLVYEKWQSELIKPSVTYILDLCSEQIPKRKVGLDVFEIDKKAMKKANESYVYLTNSLSDRVMALMDASGEVTDIAKDIYNHFIGCVVNKKRRNY